MALTCPNKNLKEWKDLLASVGENRAMLMWYESEGEVGYSLAAQTNIIDKLDKVNNWFKQMKDSDAFWSKLQKDLQIPKEQIALLRESEGNTIEKKLINFSTNYSYTVEINTAKNPKVGEKYIDTEYGYELEVTEETLQNQIRDGFVSPELNTQYYSNLTVPGGTNYTENEISTPLITPSIKGHAQFATDNGIGWFRSDEQAIQLSAQDAATNNKGRLTPFDNDYGKIPTKTRRILEVQSDLFQKGRDALELIGDENAILDELERMGKSLSTDMEDINQARKNLSTSNQNQFLQLLNKDNNWVTFFVKSIIQDSAKKGYEKVLFPSGNTASKVEGHTTLEEFKKQKEDRIKELEFTIEKTNNKEFIDRSRENLFYSDDVTDEQIKKELTTDYNREIAQLKQELEQVEGPGGFGALKPIYNFYENTVTNILNKTYGKENVKVITDEYGNTWNEIEFTDDNLGEFSIGSFKPLNTPKPLNNITLEELYKEDIDKSDNICNFDIGK